MEQEKKKLNFKTIIPIIIAIIIVITVGCVVTSKLSNPSEITSNTVKTKKEYNVGDTVSTKAWEITLMDVQYGKTLQNSLSHEDYCLPIENASYSKSAEEENIFVVITYKVKFLGKNNTYFDAGFNLQYGDGYNITNTSNLMPCLQIRNNVEDGTMVGNTYKSLWDIKNGEYKFSPLEDEKIIREFIEVPENIITNTDEPLKLIKSLRKDGSITSGSGGKITYILR